MTGRVADNSDAMLRKIDLTQTDDIGHLIARCALKDRMAFERLYDATSAKLFGVTLRLLRNRSEAEDAMQDVYVKIWAHADRFGTGKQSPMAWLIVVTRNHCIDLIRARKPSATDIDEVFDLSDGAKSPEESAINSSEGERITKCLSELDSQKAEAVHAAYVDGYNYQELADRYEIPLNTMRTWLRRSLLSLRECLER